VAIAFYFDVHVPRAVTDALLRRGVDVLTSQADGTRDWTDEPLLLRATELGRVLVTQDDDLLAIAQELRIRRRPFNGVIYAHQLMVGIGVMVRDLELIAKCGLPEDHLNRVVYLPLR
jgi:hypothetical protein